ncbi:hypothetical protein [Bradyrhizobium iriomotense]|uniref:hypothetical protein n=1 Tax=Bradyrhizobium iriomotense TaxID=441950 RepID=UPI001B8A6EF1|nr:hypothetical protein [Bradyrhizobium iriomotense]MBR1132696.1 hypothetical protein [Bradyrhizobium iriomotense]
MHFSRFLSWSGPRWQTSARAALMTAPLPIAAFGLLVKIPPEVEFFSGGFLTALNSLCLAVLAPYVVLAFVGTGALLVSPLADEDIYLDTADLLVLQFFGGAALCSLIGVSLGAAGLLFPWITIPFLTAIVACYLARQLCSTRPAVIFHSFIFRFSPTCRTGTPSGSIPKHRSCSGCSRTAWNLLTYQLR